MEKSMNTALKTVVDNGNPPPPPPVPSPLERFAASGFLFELQSTLELEELLTIFFRHLRECVPCGGMAYTHQALDLEILLGDSGRHGARYRLTVAEEDLGVVRFTRRRPFTGPELAHLEDLLSALMLPVRNALHYRRALQAAYLDPLTGLPNRRAYADNLEREISRARREGQTLGLMVLDVDHFKAINDHHGHLAGDQVLSRVAGLLRDNVRKSDLVFRYAGDEFVLLLPNVRPEGLRVLRQRLEEALAEMDFHHNGRSIPVSLSMGAALLEADMDGEALFAAADQAMYEEKAMRRRPA